jgi:MFS family permease
MLIVLTLFYTISFVDRFSLSILAESIRSDLGFTDTQMSLLLGPAFSVCYAICAIPLGWAADRYPRRWVIFSGMVFWSLCVTGTGMARSFALMFAARGGVGLGEASLSPSAYSLLSDMFPAHRLSFAISIYQMGIYIGHAGAFFFVALVLAYLPEILYVLPGLSALAPWQIVLILTGAPGALLALLVFTFSEPQRRALGRGAKQEEGAITALWPFIKSQPKLLALLTIGFGLVAMVYLAVTSWLPTYLNRQFGMGPVEYAPLFSLVSLFGAVTLLAKGGLVDLFYGRGTKDTHIRFYLWLLVLSSPAVYAMFCVQSPYLLFICYALVTIVTFPFLVFLIPVIQIISPPQIRARLSASVLFVISTVASLGPVFVGLLTDHLFGPEHLGAALGLVLGASLPITFLCLRATMPLLRRIM